MYVTLNETAASFSSVGKGCIAIFTRYHGFVITAFDRLPNESKVKTVAFRIVTCLTTPLTYPLLGGLMYVGKLFERIGTCIIEANFDPNQELKINLEKLRHQAAPNWQQQALKLIRNGRIENNPTEEIRRLRTVGVLNSKREAKLNAALEAVYVKQPSREKTLHAKVLMAQALEIKEIYKETHDVFIHAQSAKWVVFSHLIKEVIKKVQPERDLRHYKFLRAPCDTVDLGFLDSLWSFTSKLFNYKKSTLNNVKEYIDSKWYVDDSNSHEREKLLSVDAYFYNHQSYESSLFFLINNDNIFNNREAIENFSKKVIRHFSPKIKDAPLEQAVKKIVNAAFHASKCGNLFVICLPKKDSDRIHYRAHPYGKPCQCHAEHHARKILNNLQAETLSKTEECRNGSLTIPQYRLYTPLLNSGEGKYIYLLTPFNKEKRRGIKNVVKEVVQEAVLSAG